MGVTSKNGQCWNTVMRRVMTEEEWKGRGGWKDER